VEPCSFAYYARDNIREQTFKEIFLSPFLKAIRDHPSALKRGRLGCSLFENREVLEEIAPIGLGQGKRGQ